MAIPRLSSSLEVAGIVRRAQAAGDFAAVLRKGDPERGALLLLVNSRGRYVTFLERLLSLDGDYEWRRAGPGESPDDVEIRQFLEKRARFDEDGWAIELDVADVERFIAETIAVG